MRRLTMAPVLLVTTAILAGGLAACGGGQDGGSATPSGPAASTATTASTPEPSASDMPTTLPTTDLPVPTSTADVVQQDLPGAKQTAVPTAIRAGAHSGYDRVVFELDGPIGGYVVRYVDKLTQDPSDLPIEHEGDAALQVVILGATLDTSFQVAEGEKVRTYEGPDRLAANLTSVKEVVQAGDFEAVLTYGIGVSSTKAFSVTLLSDPTRLVVDVAH